jgi:hypothetical protein
MSAVSSRLIPAADMYMFKLPLDISVLSAIGTCLFTVNSITTSNAYCLQKSSVALHTHTLISPQSQLNTVA